MKWLKDGIAWAHFASTIKDAMNELRQSITQHSSAIDKLSKHDLLLIEKLRSQIDLNARLEARIQSLEEHLRGQSFVVAHQSRLGIDHTRERQDDES